MKIWHDLIIFGILFSIGLSEQPTIPSNHEGKQDETSEDFLPQLSVETIMISENKMFKQKRSAVRKRTHQPPINSKACTDMTMLRTGEKVVWKKITKN